MSGPQVGSVAFRLCVHFTKNPGTVMFTDEIRERWVMESGASGLASLLETPVRNGWISAQKIKGERHICYSAGPELTKLLEGP